MDQLFSFNAFLSSITLAILARPWFGFPEGAKILLALGTFFIGLLILTAVFYVAGLIIVGEEKARFSDALIISLLGTFIGNAVFLFLPGIFGLIAALIIWLLLIKHFYETGWLGALGVAILAVIVFIAILAILAIIQAISIPLIEILLPMLFP